MKIIKKAMSFKDYQTKYPDYETRLLSFSDAEIKEFNTIFYKDNGKNIPNKYALLNKNKWVHIDGRYYQIPRPISYSWFKGLSNLGKTGVIGGAAIVLAASIALPISLSNRGGVNVTLNEEEFKNCLTWFSTSSEDRKFKIDNGKVSFAIPFNSRSGNKTSFDMDFKTEVEGEYEVGTQKDLYGGPDEIIITKTQGDDIYSYVEEYDYEEGENVKKWRRVGKTESIISSMIMVSYKTFADNFSKFTKKNSNTYSASNIEVSSAYSFLSEVLPLVGDLKGTSSIDIVFNDDKSIKSAVENVKFELPESEYYSAETTSMTYSYTFADVGSHKISKLPAWSEDDPDDVYKLEPNITNYACNNIKFLPKNYPTTFECTIGDYPFKDFRIALDNSISSTELEHFKFNNCQQIKVTVDDGSGTETEVGYTLDDESETIILNTPVTTEDAIVRITLNGLDKNYENIHQASTVEIETPQADCQLYYIDDEGEYESSYSGTFTEATNVSFSMPLHPKKAVQYFEIYLPYNSEKLPINSIVSMELDGESVSVEDVATLSNDKKTLIFNNPILLGEHTTIKFVLSVGPYSQLNQFAARAYSYTDVSVNYDSESSCYLSEDMGDLKSGHYRFNIPLELNVNIESIMLVDDPTSSSPSKYVFEISNAYVGSKKQACVFNKQTKCLEFDVPVEYGQTGDTLVVETKFVADETSSIESCYLKAISGSEPEYTPRTMEYSDNKYTYYSTSGLSAGRHALTATIQSGQAGIKTLTMYNGVPKKLKIGDYLRNIKVGENMLTENNGYTIVDDVVVLDNAITAENTTIKFNLYVDFPTSQCSFETTAS